MIPFMRHPTGKPRVHIDEDWQFNILSVYVIYEQPDGSYQHPTSWGDENGMTLATVGIDDRNGGVKPISDHVPLLLSEGTAKELMEALQKHFGAYAGVDYERLRKDYDRQATALTKAQDFIQDTLKTIIEGRKPKTGDGS